MRWFQSHRGDPPCGKKGTLLQQAITCPAVGILKKAPCGPVSIADIVCPVAQTILGWSAASKALTRTVTGRKDGVYCRASGCEEAGRSCSPP